MKRPDENRLDRLFREGLRSPDENDAAFREDDWAAMEKLLDERKAGRKGLLWLCLVSGSIAAILLLAWLGPFSGLIERSTKQVEVKFTGTGSKRPARGNSTGADTAGSQQMPPGSQETSSGSEFRGAPPAGTEGGGLLVNGSKVKAGYVTPGDRAAEIIKNKASIAEGRQELTNGDKNELSAAESTGNMANNGRPVRALTGEKTALKSDSSSSKDTMTALAGTNAAGDDDGLAGHAKEPGDKNSRKSSQSAASRISLAVLAAPDVNGANSFSGQVGTNIGVLISVRLWNNWSVSAGAVYAFKPYDVRGGQLAGNDSYTSRQVTGVTANCNVLDVPLNLSYRLYQGSRSALSLGGGLSSYFMLREKYTFLYADRPDWGYEVSNQNKHLGGVLNLDAVYQRQLSNRLNLLVQPYLKIPLTPIGNEHIDLRSAGVAFGVGWDLHSRNREKQ